jgi:predicted MFS family arabinose efflux permease
MAIEEQDALAAPPLATATPRLAGWTRAQIYILVLLVLVNICNYLDRGVLAILQEPIKRDLGLQDWQLGMISGPAFAILYSFAGIPAARVAERVNRITVLSLALALWSGMTALCGAASSFGHLVVARLGVGAGEGACTPVSHSLVSDTFPPQRRGLALAVLTTSIPIAQMLAPLIGGYVAMTYGWRVAFAVVGLPGIALAILVRLTLREPRDDAANTLVSRRPAGRFRDDLILLLRLRCFRWLFLASVFMGWAVGATNIFTASYFLRQYHLTLAQVGVVTAIGLGVAGLLGTFSGGWLADRYAGRFGRSYPGMCAVAAAGAGLFFLVTFTRPSWQAAVAFLIVANLFNDLKNGPNYAALQNMAPPHMRTTATAILMVAVIVLGTGCGPLIVGVVSDLAAARAFPDTLGSFSAVCPGGKAPAGSAALLIDACSTASAAGLRGGLMAACLAYALAAPCFLMSALTIQTPLQDDQAREA